VLVGCGEWKKRGNEKTSPCRHFGLRHIDLQMGILVNEG